MFISCLQSALERGNYLWILWIGLLRRQSNGHDGMTATRVLIHTMASYLTILATFQGIGKV